MKSLYEKLAECAHINVDVPGSLIADTWDRIRSTGQQFGETPEVGQVPFESTLLRVVDAFLTDPDGYVLHRRAVPSGEALADRKSWQP